jgi:hypothetical protein
MRHVVQHTLIDLGIFLIGISLGAAVLVAMILST